MMITLIYLKMFYPYLSKDILPLYNKDVNPNLSKDVYPYLLKMFTLIYLNMCYHFI